MQSYWTAESEGGCWLEVPVVISGVFHLAHNVGGAGAGEEVVVFHVVGGNVAHHACVYVAYVFRVERFVAKVFQGGVGVEMAVGDGQFGPLDLVVKLVEEGFLCSGEFKEVVECCLLYTSPSPRD